MMYVGASLLFAGWGAGWSGCTPDPSPSTTVTAYLPPPQRELTRYRRLTLDNGLKVILASDARAEEAAASLSVGVGSFDNPPEHDGLAHFLEHMLFLGTKKYPRADDYQRFIGNHGGHANAYTTDDHTNYFFQVQPAAFDEALDRFAQFFVAPLLDAQYAAKELQAVDSEHARNLKNDFWRVRQVQQSLFDARHPISRFSTGNSETLSAVDARILRTFYHTHYSSHLMTLALVGQASLDTLEALARKHFSAVPRRHVEERDARRQVWEALPYFPPQEALRLLEVKPIAEQRSLTLSFPLASVNDLLASKPLQVLGHILGHEGEGSLLSLLKEAGWASGLSAGGFRSTSHDAIFALRIILTEEGRAHYLDVVQTCLAAIAALREQGVPAYLVDELAQMALLDERFGEFMGSLHWARSLSALSQEYPLSQVPQGIFRYGPYDAPAYRRVLDALRADNLLVTLLAPEVVVDRRETHYGAEYAYRVDAAGYPSLVQAPSVASVEGRWHLPRPNPYIPRESGVIAPQGALRLTHQSLLRLAEQGLPPEAQKAIEPLSDLESGDLESGDLESGAPEPNAPGLAAATPVEFSDGMAAGMADEMAAGMIAGMAAKEPRTFASGEVFLRTLLGALGEASFRRHAATILRAAKPWPRKIWQREAGPWQGAVWYQADWQFRQPRAALNFRWRSPVADGSAAVQARGLMYIEALRESRNEKDYPLQLAGLQRAILWSRRGITLRLQGYSDRLLPLLEELIEQRLALTLSEEAFATVKARLVRQIRNQAYAAATEESQYRMRLLLRQPPLSREELLEALEPLQLDEVRAFAKSFWQEIDLEGAVVGNLTPRQITRTLERLERTLTPTRAEASVSGLAEASGNDLQQRLFEPQLRSLSRGENPIYTYSLQNNNALARLYIDVGRSAPRLRTALQLIDAPLSDAFYTELRTEQQLGYVVFAGWGEMEQQLGLHFLVQSGEYPAPLLTERIEAYLPRFMAQFSALPAADFENYRQALLRKKLEPPPDLGATLSRLFYRAFEQDGDFDRPSAELDVLGRITHEEVLEVLKTLLPLDQRRSLRLQLEPIEG